MAFIHRGTLRRRLILIAILATGTALLLASAAMFVSQLLSLRNSIVNDIFIKADIIGNQCTAALVFDVPGDAEETLRSLRADARIEYAAVYSRNGSLFAVYRNENNREKPVFAPGNTRAYRFGIIHLDVTQPIVLQGVPIGSIYIRSDLHNLHALLLRFIVVAGIVLSISLLVAYALVLRLQSSLTAPVTGLVQLMERISRDGDFSVKAEISGPEELGLLARGFNDMLSAIRDRDRELERQRQDMESSVLKLRLSTEELREANKKLEALDKLKSDFISVVSHELRTPLTAIKAFVELLIVKQNMPLEKKAKLLRTVNEESDRLGRLINDLLDLNKIESGMMHWRYEQVSIDEIIQISVDMLLPAARRKGIHLAVTIEPVLPRFIGDRDRLVQVATNVLSNAVKFTREGGDITVRVYRVAAPRQLVIAVSDTGIGIPPAEIELIFDKFHRSGDVLTNNVEGTGLGLAIARQIIEHHGGRIWADSQHGSGSTFTFTIPVPEAEASSRLRPG